MRMVNAKQLELALTHQNEYLIHFISAMFVKTDEVHFVAGSRLGCGYACVVRLNICYKSVMYNSLTLSLCSWRLLLYTYVCVCL